MDFKLIIPRSISMGHCPNCKSVGTMDRVRIDKLWDKILLNIFRFRSYHCRECKYFGKFFLYKLRNNPLRIVINYCILALILFVVFFVLNIVIKRM